MSALLVEDETINRIVAWLSWEVTRRELGTITAHPPVEEERTS
jgi:predicted nucleotidyltransferase